LGNPVVHFEIGARDAKRLQQFYAKQFGWKIDAKNPMAYGITDTQSAGKGINGGIFATMDSGQPSWLTVYIEVDDIDRALAKIEKAGGKTVMPRTPLPGMVTFAQFTDPGGNLVGLVEAAIPPASAQAPQPSKRRAAKKPARKGASKAASKPASKAASKPASKPASKGRRAKKR
jgi:hypothetical protein